MPVIYKPNKDPRPKKPLIPAWFYPIGTKYRHRGRVWKVESRFSYKSDGDSALMVAWDEMFPLRVRRWTITSE